MEKNDSARLIAELRERAQWARKEKDLTAEVDAQYFEQSATALEAAEARAVELDTRATEYALIINKQATRIAENERQLAAAREVLKPVACRCRKTCLDGVHDCWRRKARAALTNAEPAP